MPHSPVRGQSVALILYTGLVYSAHMTEVLTPKRGCGLLFSGTNWNSASDVRWQDHLVWAPGGSEKLVGTRIIREIEVAVFQCLDDDFMAQPTAICKLPLPEDAMEILCLPEHLKIEIPADDTEDKPKKRSKKPAPMKQSGILCFRGTNWRLAGTDKWRPLNGPTPSYDKPVGSRIIGNFTYDIYSWLDGFMAIRQKD